jgi:copper homeostasis protein
VSGGLLEIAVTDPRDVPGADEGGADRLHLEAPGPAAAMSPELTTVSAVCRETDLPVFVLLRLSDSWTTTGGEIARLVGLAESFLSCGAAGVSFGFMDRDLLVDTEVCAHLTERLPGVPWTFHRAIDATLEPRRAWGQLLTLPGLVNVRSAGSPQGLAVGYEDLLDLARDDADVARLLMPGGGLLGEHVPWFVRAGVRAFHLGPQARPGGTCKAYVDAAHVRSWRLLLDDAVGRMSAAG